MGARTLEASLRLRALLLLAPLLLAVGAAMLVVTNRTLGELQARAARDRGEAALRMLHDEVAEGDDLELAMREVLMTADADRFPIVLRSATPALERSGRRAMPAPLAALADGACDGASDDQGVPWLACAERAGPVTAIVALPMHRTRAALQRLSAATLAIIVLALGGTATAVRFAVRRSTREVAALSTWSRGVAAGTRPSPPPPGQSLEVTQLAVAFDDVVRRLFDAVERERSQSAHIAHELRTPLTAIRGELEILAQHGAEGAVRALADADRLRDVIDAILVLATPRDTPAGLMTVNLADIARERAPQGATVEAPDEALVTGDARLLELAVRNLVENAERHGRGARAIRVQREGEGLRLAVVDEGPGIPEAQRERMFERHWRGVADRDGSGLGLALVRAVAERHGGRAEAAPGSPRGLVVSIVLPALVDWSEPGPR
jgi:signal transduction histidine kinase